MKKALRLLLSATMAGFVSFVATTTACSDECDPATQECPGEEDPKAVCYNDPYACTTCKTNEWCGGKKDRFKWICTAEQTCVRVCTRNADCRAALGEVCEDAVCRPPACGTDAECGNGEHCIGGSCATAVKPAEVASCVVLPAKSLLHEGDDRKFSIVAKSAAGAVLAYKGAIEWSVDNAARATVGTDGFIKGGAETGSVAIKAKVGSIDCTASDAQNFAAVAGGKTRVVVADLLSQQVVAGAKVVIGSETKSTDSTGLAEFDNVAGKPTISVFHKDYAYVTMVDVNTKDVVAYLKPPAVPGKFQGEMGARSFDNLSDLKGNIHLSINGASIPGNLIDIQLGTLLGEMVPTTLELSPTQKFDLSLPAGIVIGMGEQMFKSKYDVLASPGVRTLWGIGGNAEFGAISSALAPVIGGNTSNVNVGGILASILPLVAKLQSGVLTGQESVSNKTKALTADEFKLEKLLRLKLLAKLPDLPKYKVGADEYSFEGAVVIGGALHGSQGLVPLGLTAGVDQQGATGPDGKPVGDGKIDTADPSVAPAGTMPLRVAPLHGGLEGSKYVSLALAASFSGLVSSDEEDPAAAKKPLVLAGLIAFPGDIAYSTDAAMPVDFGSAFLAVPENPSITERTFDQGTKVDGAVFHRLDIGGDDTGEWFVYFPAGADPASFAIPTPPDGFADRFTAVKEGDTELPKAILQSIRFKTSGTSSLNYDSMLEFDSENMDDLSARIDAFSTREIIRPDVQ